MSNIYDKIKSEGNSRNEPSCENLFEFDTERSIEGCTVITFDGIPGFMWVGPDGVRRNAGLRYPTMRIVSNATVHILYDEVTGEHSAGWTRGGD